MARYSFIGTHPDTFLAKTMAERQSGGLLSTRIDRMMRWNLEGAMDFMRAMRSMESFRGRFPEQLLNLTDRQL